MHALYSDTHTADPDVGSLREFIAGCRNIEQHILSPQFCTESVNLTRTYTFRKQKCQSKPKTNATNKIESKTKLH